MDKVKNIDKIDGSKVKICDLKKSIKKKQKSKVVSK